MKQTNQTIVVCTLDPARRLATLRDGPHAAVDLGGHGEQWRAAGLRHLLSRLQTSNTRVTRFFVVLRSCRALFGVELGHPPIGLDDDLAGLRDAGVRTLLEHARAGIEKQNARRAT